MLIDLQAALTVLATLTVVGGGIAAALVAIRRWIRNVARPAQATTNQLRTSNGHTAGQLIEQVATDVGELKGMARDNRTLVEQMSRRLDDHIVRGHGS